MPPNPITPCRYTKTHNLPPFRTSPHLYHSRNIRKLCDKLIEKNVDLVERVVAFMEWCGEGGEVPEGGVRNCCCRLFGGVSGVSTVYRYDVVWYLLQLGWER